MAEDWRQDWRQDQPEQTDNHEAAHGSHVAPEGSDHNPPTPPWEHGAHSAPEAEDDQDIAFAEEITEDSDGNIDTAEAVEDSDGDIDEVEVAETDEATPAASKPKTKAPALTPITVRRIIAKTDQLRGIDEEKLDLLANALGVAPQIDKIVVALFMGAPKSGALTDLRKVAAEGPIKGTVLAMKMSDSERRALWDAARALGADLPKRMAKGDAAAINLVGAITDMDDLPGKIAAIEDLMKR